MPKRITWKKGMRLSAEVFVANDEYKFEAIRNAALICTNRRMGLFTAAKEFDLSVNITNTALEVVSLSCHGITRSGQIVDIDFDSNYSNTFDTRLNIPVSEDDDTYLLTVRMHDSQWREVSESLSEVYYTFELIGENSPISDDSLPIGRIVNRYGWRLDDTDFCPPCLYVSSHKMYRDTLSSANGILRRTLDRCIAAENCIAKTLVKSVWEKAYDVLSRFDKERDTLTPAQLLCGIQQFICAFVIGFRFDEHVNLEDPELYLLYINKPYDAKYIYRDIVQGLSMCTEIYTRMETVWQMEEMIEKPVEKPHIKEPEPEPAKPKKNRWEGLEI